MAGSEAPPIDTAMSAIEILNARSKMQSPPICRCVFCLDAD